MPVVQSLFNTPGKYSSIELSLEQGADADDVKKQLQEKLGNTYKVETRYEQNKTLYMVMRSEKWAIFAILLMVLLIASFNMVGALSLLVMEKQKDMAILKAMGAEGTTVRNIFMAEGILWSLVGGLTGLVLGILICMGQQQFQWIKMQGSWIIEAYPVRLQPLDALLIIVTVVLVGLLASWYPALRAIKTEASLRSN
jgi:lipoprotein-releasing system permease protein